MAGQALSNRALNRATLARQFMLERQDVEIVSVVHLLCGLQAQTTNGPYQALWNRIRGFRHEHLTTLIENKTLLRATTMRTTLHLHTVPDLRSIRPVVQPVLDRVFSSVAKNRAINADRAAVNSAGRAILDEQPMTASELGKRLELLFPQGDPYTLAQVVQGTETLIQIPPTRIWGHGGPPLLTRIETWIGQPLDDAIALPDLVLRYLAAFGPASVKDMQNWCGLTRLTGAFDAVADQLVTFPGEDGRLLYDLPDAPRPAADIPAPARFLPEYDNVFLGFFDRLRIQPDHARERMKMVNGYASTFLVDGFIAGKWALAKSKSGNVMILTPFRKLTATERTEVELEGAAMAGFLTETSAQPEMVWAAIPDA